VYRSLRFDASAAEADDWSDALLGAGALAVDLSDPHAGGHDEVAVYGEPSPSGSPPEASHRLWPLSRISALFDGAADAQAALSRAAVALGRPAPPAEVSVVADRDWVRETQAQFGPIRIDDGFFIVPSWCAPPSDASIVLTLDPGLAFGTGSHPTTRLCLQWLRASVRGGERVLDYGCGSGILAIGAARLGAASVSGTDLDPQALDASRANAEANGVKATFGLPERVPAGPYDMVIANILTNPLVLLAPVLARLCAPAGRIALSGILANQAEEVIDAYARWFNIAAWRADDGWVLLAGVRR
jgi:ribosomal protein L11 methyltransferase